MARVRRRQNESESNALGEMVHLRDTFMSEMSSFRSGFQDRFGVTSSRSYGAINLNSGGADSRLTEGEYFNIIEDSRTAHEKFSFVRGLTRQARIHRVQEGFTYDAQTQDAEIDKFLNDYVYNWTSNPEEFDVNGELDFAGTQKIAEDAIIRDGDIWCLGLEDGTTQLIEGHRVRGSTALRGGPSAEIRNAGLTEHLGVICAPPLRRKAIRVVQRESRGASLPVKLDELKTYQIRDYQGIRQIFHMHDADRVSLTRGVSAWANVIETTNMLDQGRFSLLVKVVLAASLAWVVQTKAGNLAPEYGATSTANVGNLVKTAIQEINPGAVVNLEEGEEMKMLSSTLGAGEATALMDVLIQDLSLNLGLPLFVGMMDAQKTGNFSSARMTWDLAKLGIRAQRQTRKAQFALPLRRWKLQWLLRQSGPVADKARTYYKRIVARDGSDAAFFECHCQAGGWPYPQPLDDASANALSVSTFQNSLRRIHSEKGQDIEIIADEQARDKELIIEAYVDAYKRFTQKHSDIAEDFTFKDFLELGMYRGIALPRAKDDNTTQGNGSQGSQETQQD